MPTIEVTAAGSTTTGFSLCFSNEYESARAAICAPVEFIAGDERETLVAGLREVPSMDGVRLFERNGLRVGFVDEAAQADLAKRTHDVYRRIFAAVGERRLARVWNYVPRINQKSGAGMENYRAFCFGRSLAFEERHGGAFRAKLPAASAVGGLDGRLALVFVATETQPEHLENPAQVPAYNYPPEHGPRAPSFARATRVDESGERFVFISGTAAIKGHVSIAREHLGGQIACTLDNLRIISNRCGLGPDIGAGEGERWRRHFKVYLRHAEHYAETARELERRLFKLSDRVTWLRADICRKELLVEIEATLVGR